MIHPTAVVSSKATLGEGVEVAPFAVIEDDVVIGDGCRIGPHSHITGHTTIGKNTKIFTGAVIGDEPQDYHYKGEVSYTDIGDDCIIREYVTIHRGAQPESRTVIGNHVMLMALGHVAHNCVIGDNVIIANSALLAGHVEIDDRAVLSGGVAVHQFARIGTLAMISGLARVTQDVPPYCMLSEDVVHGPNVIGLKRAGISPESRRAIREAIKIFFLQGLNRPNAVEKIRQELSGIPEVDIFLEFVSDTRRGYMPGRARKDIGNGGQE